MNELQKEIASRTLAEIVSDAITGNEEITDKVMKERVISAAKALKAGFAELETAI